MKASPRANGRRLALSTETLRHLSARELRQVGGGDLGDGGTQDYGYGWGNGTQDTLNGSMDIGDLSQWSSWSTIWPEYSNGW